MNFRLHAAFAVVASLVVATAVVWGFVLVGSPATRRLERFDEQRLRDLQTLAGEIEWTCVDREKKNTLKQAVPATLEEAARQARGSRINTRDPETGEPYGYTRKDESTFEACATFARERKVDWSVFWNHPAGPHCFTINVLDPPPR